MLPFDDPSKDEADAFLGGGLQQEVANSLARYPGLRVVSPRGVKLHPASNSDQEAAREIGTRLGVAYAVEGSIRRESGTGRLRVQVNLIDTHAGTREWSATYDRDVTDLFYLAQQDCHGGRRTPEAG